jgi:hypothetical protein
MVRGPADIRQAWGIDLDEGENVASAGAMPPLLSRLGPLTLNRYGYIPHLFPTSPLCLNCSCLLTYTSFPWAKRNRRFFNLVLARSPDVTYWCCLWSERHERSR